MPESNDIRKATVSSQPTKPKKAKTITFSSRAILGVAAIILVAGLSFWGGIVYQQHNGKTAQVSTNGSGFTSGRGGRFGGFGGGGFGNVTAVSSSSITVQNLRSGTDKTFAITSSTNTTNNGQSVSASTITTGERVVVIPSSSNSSDAATILVNPSFGGGPSASGSGTSTTGLSE